MIRAKRGPSSSRPKRKLRKLKAAAGDNFKQGNSGLESDLKEE